jgi:hypothetical protein
MAAITLGMVLTEIVACTRKSVMKDLVVVVNDARGSR